MNVDEEWTQLDAWMSNFLNPFALFADAKNIMKAQHDSLEVVVADAQTELDNEEWFKFGENFGVVVATIIP